MPNDIPKGGAVPGSIPNPTGGAAAGAQPAAPAAPVAPAAPAPSAKVAADGMDAASTAPAPFAATTDAPPVPSMPVLQQLQTVFNVVKAQLNPEDATKLQAGLQPFVDKLSQRDISGAFSSLPGLLSAGETPEELGELTDAVKAAVDDPKNAIPDGPTKTVLENLDAFVGLASDADGIKSIRDGFVQFGQDVKTKQFGEALKALFGTLKNDNARQVAVVLLATDPTIAKGLGAMGMSVAGVRGAVAAAPSLIASATSIRQGHWQDAVTNLMAAAAAAPDQATGLLSRWANALPPNSFARHFFQDDRFNNMVKVLISSPDVWAVMKGAVAKTTSSDPAERRAGLVELAKLPFLPVQGLTDAQAQAMQSLRNALIDAIAGTPALQEALEPPLAVPGDLEAVGSALPDVIQGVGLIFAKPPTEAGIRQGLGCLGTAYSKAPTGANATLGKLLPPSMQVYGLGAADYIAAASSLPDLYDLAKAVGSGDAAKAKDALFTAAPKALPVTAKLLQGLAADPKGPFAGTPVLQRMLGTPGLNGQPNPVVKMLLSDRSFYTDMSNLFAKDASGKPDVNVRKTALSHLANNVGVREAIESVIGQQIEQQLGLVVGPLVFEQQTAVTPFKGPDGSDFVQRTTTNTDAASIGVNPPNLMLGNSPVSLVVDASRQKSLSVSIIRPAGQDPGVKSSTPAKWPNNTAEAQALHLGKGGKVQLKGNLSWLAGGQVGVGFKAGPENIEVQGGVTARVTANATIEIEQLDEAGTKFRYTIVSDDQHAKVEILSISAKPLPDVSGLVKNQRLNTIIQNALGNAFEIAYTKRFAQATETQVTINGAIIDTTQPGGQEAADHAFMRDANSALFFGQYSGTGVTLDNAQISNIHARSNTDLLKLTNAEQWTNETATVDKLSSVIDGNSVTVDERLAVDRERDHNSKSITENSVMYAETKGARAPLPANVTTLAPGQVRQDVFPDPVANMTNTTFAAAGYFRAANTNASVHDTLQTVDTLSETIGRVQENQELRALERDIRAGNYKDPGPFPSLVSFFKRLFGLKGRNQPFDYEVTVEWGAALKTTPDGARDALAEVFAQPPERLAKVFEERYRANFPQPSPDKLAAAQANFLQCISDLKALYAQAEKPGSPLYAHPLEFKRQAEVIFQKAMAGDNRATLDALAELSPHSTLNAHFKVSSQVAQEVVASTQQHLQSAFALQLAVQYGARIIQQTNDNLGYGPASEDNRLYFTKPISPALAQQIAFGLFPKQAQGRSMLKMEGGEFAGIQSVPGGMADFLNHATWNDKTGLMAPKNVSERTLKHLYGEWHGDGGTVVPRAVVKNGAVIFNNHGNAFISETGALRKAFPDAFVSGKPISFATETGTLSETAQYDLSQPIVINRDGTPLSEHLVHGAADPTEGDMPQTPDLVQPMVDPEAAAGVP